MSAVIASKYTAGVESEAAYNAVTAGVLLGAGPRGITPTAFVQALMAAGIVRRVSVTWVVHTAHPDMPTAVQLGLHDLETARRPNPLNHHRPTSRQRFVLTVTCFWVPARRSSGILKFRRASGARLER